MLIRIKSILKNRKTILWIVNTIVSLYISVIVYFSVWNTLKMIAFLPLMFVGCYYILMVLSTKINTEEKLCREKSVISPFVFFCMVFLIVFAGQMLYWLAYYPGGFNLDAYGQWDQVHGLQHLNNWHPVFTTVCYWLITRIYDNFAFCIFIQLLIFSLSISYLLLVLFRLKVNNTLLVFAALYLAFNPAIGMNNICLFKDVPFTISIIWMTAILIRIVETKGGWLKFRTHLACLVINLVVVTLIRHNGIFYIVPVLLCILFLFWEKRKSVLKIVLSYILILLIIQGPLYSYLNVEEHSNFVGESVGIPMAIMANIFVSDTENTPIEVKELLLSIADEKAWKDKYILGEWDSCKWDFGGIELFQDETLERFIKLTFMSIYASPDAAYKSVRENTRVVWQVWGHAEWTTWVYIEENDYGICENPNNLCTDIVNIILDLSTTSLGGFFCWNIGLPNIILVLFLWIIVTRKEYQKLILIIPTVVYNLLTMLLLCGPSHRYFYFNNVIILPTILILIFVNSKNVNLLKTENILSSKG